MLQLPPPPMANKLLELPAELLREILHTLDPESFYMCLLTSKLFRSHALNSTSLLLDHLDRIPGPRNPRLRQNNNAEALMKVFGKRAAQHLTNGVSWMADTYVWRTSRRADRRASKITSSMADEEGSSLENAFVNDLGFLEVLSDEATINIYSLEPNKAKEHRPVLTHVISSHCLPEYFPVPGNLPVQYEIIKVAVFDAIYEVDTLPRVAVLYRAFWKDSPYTSDWMKVIVFRLDDDFGPMVADTFEVRAHSQPIAMAVSGEGSPVIVYRDFGAGFGHNVVIYRNVTDEITAETHTLEEDTETLGPGIQFPNERITGVTIHENKYAHLYPAAYPIPQWTIPRLQNLGERIERRDTYLPDVVEVFPKQSLGKVIAHHHHHRIKEKDLNDGEPTCVNTALELMISRDESFGLASRTGAFLLKAIHYPSTCKHFNPERDYHTLHHVFVACLAGLPDLHNLSTLGLRLAVSPRAHRIAIASWKTVKIWSMDPQAFLDPEYSLAGQEGVPGDYAFIEGCGWQFYRNMRFEKECVVLEPVELPSLGVVYGLEWRCEDELWGFGKGSERGRGFGVRFCLLGFC
ncbi:uncharacterized protein BDR25DRAFT_392369 [Lindgomyces ingoldianus]|uniref:Uncharacterized protein n=1 Tax=Lindgomyces ingoldianus TaxID=673940 RepID=A0ACB6R171_9PLEO|nr:uncharacterized protein BDR25DRAFT_392369 [Lindgomyces ingoldianus]KAF2473034.1 hypothetical protein BDR25DRAFT_392369 [Lindgomyces ingoldianus]